MLAPFKRVCVHRLWLAPCLLLPPLTRWPSVECFTKPVRPAHVLAPFKRVCVHRVWLAPCLLLPPWTVWPRAWACPFLRPLLGGSSSATSWTQVCSRRSVCVFVCVVVCVCVPVCVPVCVLPCTGARNNAGQCLSRCSHHFSVHSKFQPTKEYRSCSLLVMNLLFSTEPSPPFTRRVLYVSRFNFVVSTMVCSY